MSAQLDFKGLLEVVQVKTEPMLPNDIKKDKEALYVLKSAIDPRELEKTGVCATAHELWKKIQENYEGSLSRLFKRLFLRSGRCSRPNQMKT